jgi:hypothetical protein
MLVLLHQRFQGTGGSPFGNPPHNTMAKLMHVKLLTAIPASMMPNATALLTLSVDWIRSNAVLKNGAAASARVRRTGRKRLVVM